MVRKLSRRFILNTMIPAALIAVTLPARGETLDQPHMEAALQSLKDALHELQAATDGKGGHRGNALKLIKRAITEVERGIRFADTH